MHLLNDIHVLFRCSLCAATRTAWTHTAGAGRGRLGLRFTLSSLHPVCSCQIDARVCLCVKLCRGGLRRRGWSVKWRRVTHLWLQLCFAKQLSVAPPWHPEVDIIRGESSFNPQPCWVSSAKDTCYADFQCRGEINFRGKMIPTLFV